MDALMLGVGPMRRFLFIVPLCLLTIHMANAKGCLEGAALGGIVLALHELDHDAFRAANES